MKKILMLSDINSTHTQKWVNSLIQEGHQIMLFSFTNPANDWHISLHNFSFISLGENKKYKKRTFLSKINYFKSVSILKRAYNSFNPDIVHAHYASSYGLMGTFLKHDRYYVSVWGSDVFQFPKRSYFTRFLLKRVFKFASKIFSTSHIMAEEIKLYTKKKVKVIPFGVDTERFKPSKKDDEHSTKKIVIGYIKSIEQTYGPDILIKAFSKALKTNNQLELKIIGDGSLKQEIKNLVFDLKLEKSIKFIGWVPYEQIALEYQSLDIFINPSRFESFGVSVLEASSCGVPVITTNVGGLKEVSIHNKTALLVRPDNIKELTDAILTLASNATLRKEFGKNGRLFVIENYSLKNAVNSLLKEYG